MNITLYWCNFDTIRFHHNRASVHFVSQIRAHFLLSRSRNNLKTHFYWIKLFDIRHLMRIRVKCNICISTFCTAPHTLYICILATRFYSGDAAHFSICTTHSAQPHLPTLLLCHMALIIYKVVYAMLNHLRHSPYSFISTNNKNVIYSTAPASLITVFDAIVSSAKLRFKFAVLAVQQQQQ